MKPVWKCYFIYQEKVLYIYVYKYKLYKIGYAKSYFIYAFLKTK